MKRITVEEVLDDDSKSHMITINVFKIESFYNSSERIGNYYKREDVKCLKVNLDSGKSYKVYSNVTEFNKMIDKAFE